MPTMIDGDFFIESTNIEEECPKCKSKCKHNELRDPLCLPIHYNEPNQPNYMTFYCDECSYMFNAPFLLKITFERYKNDK